MQVPRGPLVVNPSFWPPLYCIDSISAKAKAPTAWHGEKNISHGSFMSDLQV